MRIVVVSPHRDDAAFSLGLAVAAWLDAGHAVEVLNAFTLSDYAPYSDVDSLHANDRQSFVSALRRREDSAWNKLLGGRVRFHDLDMLDAPLRLGCEVGAVATEMIRPGDRALTRLGGALAKLARAAETTPDGFAFALPLALGGHIDHRLAREAGKETLGASGLPMAFYEDLPYAALEGIADGIPAMVGELGLDLAPVFAQLPAPSADEAASRKLRMALSYDSQMGDNYMQMLSQFCVRYGGRERLWANPAWQELFGE